MSDDFEQKLINLLKNLHSTPDNYDSWRNGLNDVELYNLLNYAIDNGLVTGIKTELNHQSEISIALSNPRLSVSGRNYLEK